MKYLFIWQRVKNATEHYHTEGGIIATGSTLEEARERMRLYKVPADCKAFTGEPDKTIETGEVDLVMVFQDSGCC